MPSTPKPSELTPESVYLRRRELLATAAKFTATSVFTGTALWGLAGGFRTPKQSKGSAAQPLDATKAAPPYTVDDELTPERDVTTYNNFYELGLSKEDPARLAGTLKLRPWTVVVDGLVNKPTTFGIEDLLAKFPLEERVYRHRCVEAWSMVIPWVGFPLAALLRAVEPLGSAKHVAFTTLLDPVQLPGQERGVLAWPYVEGLRLDEALHPLTLLAVGLYGKTLLGQNGAPVRLVVPWKYGFKGIKSIVRISLVEAQPPTTWALAAPSEYGFFANVNPAVDHPRWSQASERRLGELSKRDTLPFNGYAEQVAHLYSGMDLSRYF